MRMNFEEKKEQMRGWIILNWRVELRRKIKFTKLLKEEITKRMRTK
jgi:hypothetical protein